jgi:hypothetical protein
MGVIARVGFCPAKAQAFLTATPFKSYIGGEWGRIGERPENGYLWIRGLARRSPSFFVMQPADVDRADRRGDRPSVRPAGPAGRRSSGRIAESLGGLVERDAEALGEIEALDGGKLRARASETPWALPAACVTTPDVAINGTYGSAVPAEAGWRAPCACPTACCAFIVPGTFRWA